MAWSAAEFTGFRHGYAGTIYKGQGKTLDHTYLYHTHHWRSAASYVALTRQRESAQVFVARETARDARAARAADGARRDQGGLGRLGDARRADGRTLREKPAEREPRERMGAGAIPAQEDSLRAKVHEALQRREWAEAYWRDVAAVARSPAPDLPAAKVRTASEMREQQSKDYWRSVIAAAPSEAQDSLTAKVHAASEARQRRWSCRRRNG